MESEEKRDYTAERNTRSLPIAKELLKRLALREDLKMGDVPQEELIEYYSKVYVEDIIPYLLENNVRIGDISYIFKIMLQVINYAQDRTELTIDLLYNKATAKKWGKADTDEVTVTELDTVLKEHFNEEKVAKTVDN